jgi:hypothetical protein
MDPRHRVACILRIRWSRLAHGALPMTISLTRFQGREIAFGTTGGCSARGTG